MNQGPSWQADNSSDSQEIPRIYGTRKLVINALPRTRHLPEPEADQYIPIHSTSSWSILTLSYLLFLVFQVAYFTQTSPIESLYAFRRDGN